LNALQGLSLLLGEPIIPFEEMLWRFGMASLFGMVLGLDREMRGISAGVRTHMLVALSSAMTMLIALELFEELSVRGENDPDPTRAIQGLAQAIGFLCAGVIFVARGSVYGLTTAASLWMTSTIGMASGAGLYSIAFAGSVFALLIVSVMWVVKRWTPDPKPATAETETRGT
jgi:putative Mg2+ transporter-C (MgtC) family protein